MSTPDGTGFGGPAELRLPLAQLDTPGSTPATPSIPTPGVSPSVIRHPGAPTLPEPDPATLALLVQRMYSEQPGGGVVAPGAGPATFEPAIAEPPITPGAAPTAAPTEAPAEIGNPFGAPLRFDAIGVGPGLDPTTLAPSRVPLVDLAPAPTVATAEAPSRFEPVVEPRSTARPAASSPEIFDPYALRREFPILEERVHGKRLVWLDNAATTQKPRAVIDRLSYFYEHENSNVHRAAHTLAARATDAYESGREASRRLLNAPSAKNIVFVRGTTEGINLVAQSWGRRHLHAGDQIVITWLEHHANIVPWQQLCAERGAKLCVAPVDDRGVVILDEYEKLLTPRTKLVAFTQVSNALGTITPAREMTAMAKRHGATVLVDGAQAVSHMRVDVQALGCDFYVFSGHKVFAPTGIGAVYGTDEVLQSMPPWQGGGNMIEDVTFERTRYQPPPARFEAGTGNIADAVGLAAALDWLARVGVENVGRHEHDLLEYGTERLATVPGLRMIGTAPDKAGVLSFVLDGQKTEEVGGMLDQHGIAVRSGHHCAQPILRRFGVEATVRASLAPYNTREDLDALVAALHEIQTGRAVR